MEPDQPVQCPSMGPRMPGARLLAVVRGTAESPLLAYLDEPAPVTEDLLALAGGASPTEVFRFAAPCISKGCSHFDGESCRLATRIVKGLPQAVDEPPDCALRAACRWWTQEGDAACLRCPMVVSESRGEGDFGEALRIAADPATPV